MKIDFIRISYNKLQKIKNYRQKIYKMKMQIYKKT